MRLTELPVLAHVDEPCRYLFKLAEISVPASRSLRVRAIRQAVTVGAALFEHTEDRS